MNHLFYLNCHKMKIKVILLSVLTLFLYNHTKACDIYSTFCLEAIQIDSEKIVVGTITNSLANSIELSIIDVLYGVENNNTITIWDASTFECNGPWPNEANEMGNIGDTILCIIEPITTIINPWDVIGEYRRANSIGGFSTYVNFSIGQLFEGVYSFNEILTLDFPMYCCNDLSQYSYVSFFSLPGSTSSVEPITLSGFPEGGTFSGPGIVFSTFNPSLAGPGIHTITYTINDEFGCSFSTQENILVYTINFNFVNYNLGTISPKIYTPNQIDLELQVPEQDQYSFQIFDMNGKRVYHKIHYLETGIQPENIQLNQHLPKGMYIFSVFNKNVKVSKKFTNFN